MWRPIGGALLGWPCARAVCEPNEEAREHSSIARQMRGFRRCCPVARVCAMWPAVAHRGSAHIVQADIQAVDNDGDGVLYYANTIDDEEKRAAILAVLAEHGLQ